MFSKGDSVKVNKGVSIPDLEEFDFTDWQGRIINFIESDEVKGEYLLEVEWDSITLRNMPQDYIQQCEDEGYDIETFIFEKDNVTKTKARDKVQDRIAALNEINYPLARPPRHEVVARTTESARVGRRPASTEARVHASRGVAEEEERPHAG